MKKLIILAFVAILSIGNLAAQGQGRGGANRMTSKERVERLKKELKLSDEQTEQVTQLYTDFDKKMSNASREDRQQMRTEMEQLNKNIENLLDDNQKKAFKKLQQRNERQGRDGNGGRGRGGFGGGGGFGGR